MKYICLIYQDEADLQKKTKEEMGKLTAEYLNLAEDLQKRGQYIASYGLSPIKNTTTVRVRDGKTTATDGPFAETKEQLGGIFVIEAKDLNEAVRIASKIPSARFGGIEVRSLWGEA